jgi:hypothetical protein
VDDFLECRVGLQTVQPHCLYQSLLCRRRRPLRTTASDHEILHRRNVPTPGEQGEAGRDDFIAEDREQVDAGGESELELLIL